MSTGERIQQLQKQHHSSTIMKHVLLILFILSFLSLPLALYVVAKSTPADTVAAPTENLWLFYLLLPIPLASVFLGAKYKKKGLKTLKNIIAGAIFAGLHVLYGSFTFIFSIFYLHDYSYVASVESTIHFSLPDTGKITTQDWTIGTQTTPDSVQYFYTSDVKFDNQNDISAFNMSIKDSKLWMTSISTPLSSLVPSLYSSLPHGYDFFMLYNVDLKTYNAIPDQSGSYRFLFLAYDSKLGRMKIGDYTYKVLLN